MYASGLVIVGEHFSPYSYNPVCIQDVFMWENGESYTRKSLV
jgi:hypothetical protein